MGLSVLKSENAHRQGSGQAALANLLQMIVRNQQALADAIGTELPFNEGNLTTLVNNVRTKEDGIKLPVKLQSIMLNAHAFDMAVELRYIQLADDGHLLWMLGSNTLLAYFLGRLFCGDYSRFSQRKGCCLWLTGDGVFPAADLQALFRINSLKDLRRKRKNLMSPENFQLVDNLFARIN